MNQTAKNMQREREQTLYEEQSFIQAHYPKVMPAQLDQVLQKLYLEWEIKIYDTYYRDQGLELPLFVKCQRSQDEYSVWVGYCQDCGQDHETKYFKIGKQNIYIPLSKQHDYRVIDCEQFSRKVCEMFCRELNVFLKQIENDRIESDIQAYQQIVDAKTEQYSQLLENTYLLCCGEEIYKKFITKFQGGTKILKSLCTNNKLYPWYGYCSHCKENPPHSFFVSFGGQQTPEPLPSQMKLRMVNYQGLKNGFMTDIRDKIWILVQWKFYLSTVSAQNERLGILSKIGSLEKSNSHFIEENDILQQNMSKFDEEKQKFQQLFEKEQRTRSVLETKRADYVFKPDIQFDTFYDIEIKCESILQLTAGQGWKIKVNSEQYDSKKKANTVVVSFYGLYNKGKTFLASKLSGKNLPLGYSVSTVGLSALYPRDLHTENAIVFLDTAGTETPICYQKEDEIVQQHIRELQATMEEYQDLKPYEKKRRIYEIKLKDRLLTEHMLQRFILSESNIILIVVDQLTKEEQRLVQKIKNLYEQSEIIIVHNLSKLVSLEDVNKYINIDIIESFEVKEQYRIFSEVQINGLCYVEQRYDTQGSKLPDITHVVMAHENSEAGKNYNPFCYHYLKNRILAVTRAKEFDIISNLTRMIKFHLPEIIELPAEKFNQLKLEHTNDKIVTNLNSSSLKSISFDLLGDLKVFKGGLDPKYSIIISETELLLQVELAGCFIPTERDVTTHEKKVITCPETGSRMFEWHGFRRDTNDKMQYIILRGIKKDILVEGKTEILANGREKGEFRLIIPINPGICVLRDDPPKFVVKNGVAELLYILQCGNDEIDDFF